MLNGFPGLANQGLDSCSGFEIGAIQNHPAKKEQNDKLEEKASGAFLIRFLGTVNSISINNKLMTTCYSPRSSGFSQDRVAGRLSFFMPGADLVQMEYQSMEIIDAVDISCST